MREGLIIAASDMTTSLVRGIDAKENQSVGDVLTKAFTSSRPTDPLDKELIERGWNVPRLLPMQRVQPSEPLSAR